MNWTLEVVCVPVTDVDRAKTFYADGLGFHVDHDTVMGEMRIVQLTPPGSGCSVCIGTGLTKMTPGSVDGLQLVVGRPAGRPRRTHRPRRRDRPDRGLRRRGSAAGPSQGDDLHNVGFFFFADPDGNAWAVQQISTRPRG